MERRSRWTFGVQPNNAWQWRNIDTDGTERSSDRGFATLADCIVDAKQNGYVVWTVNEERRRTDVRDALE